MMVNVVMTDIAEQRTGRQSEEAAEKTRAAILEAALNEFANHGFEGSSLRNIAKAAGTTHGLIRHHFGSKEAVFYAVVDQSIASYAAGEKVLVKQLSQIDLNDPKKLIATHKEMLRNFAQTSAANPAMMRLLMHEGGKPSERLKYLYKQIEALNATYAFFFEHLHAQGVLPYLDHQACFLFILTNLGLVFGLSEVSSHYVGGDILTETQLEAYTERIIKILYPND